MKKIVGIYSISLGISIIGIWVMLLSTGNVPEVETEPISIYFHLAAESLMGILLLVSGIALIVKQKWGNLSFILSSGLVIYSVIISAGYYGNINKWEMVIMFMLILVLTIIFNFINIKSMYKDY